MPCHKESLGPSYPGPSAGDLGGVLEGEICEKLRSRTNDNEQERLGDVRQRRWRWRWREAMNGRAEEKKNSERKFDGAQNKKGEK